MAFIRLTRRRPGAYLRSLSVVDQGIYRKALNGAHFTNDSVCHWSETGATTCEFCGGVDSRYHRFWKCPTLAPYRKECPTWILDIIDNLPPCLTVSGWKLRSPGFDKWMQTLLAIDWPQVSFQPQFDSATSVDLFTDGSCMWPKHPGYRIASWSSVQGGWFNQHFGK